MFQFADENAINKVPHLRKYSDRHLNKSIISFCNEILVKLPISCSRRKQIFIDLFLDTIYVFTEESKKEGKRQKQRELLCFR